MPNQRVKITDIAKMCKVSVGTVSRALADDKLINVNTREKIKKTADEVGYVPNELARGLTKKNNKIIGLIIPDIMNPFFTEIAKSIEECARENDFNVFFCNSNFEIETEKKYIEQLYSYGVAGIIIVPVALEIDHIIKRYSPTKQIVFLANIPSKISKANYVIADDYLTTYIAANYLFNIGHRKIVYLGGLDNLSCNQKRIEGFKKALSEKKVKPFNFTGEQKNYSNNSNIISEIKNDLVLAKELPTAIIAYNDNLALQIIQAIEELGLNVPDDISVVGIDDIFVSRYHKIQLTTVNQNKSLMGKKCAEILINKIINKKEEVLTAVFKPELIVRKSTKPI